MRSMTGCGNGKVQRDGWEVTAELKTVNHRFLDISMRLPRNIAFLEQGIRETIADGLKRGHTDVFIAVKKTEGSSVQINVDQDLARKYYEAAESLSHNLSAENDLSVSGLLSLEGVMTLCEQEMDRDLITDICNEAVSCAVQNVISMREREGSHLREDLRYHLDRVCAFRELRKLFWNTGRSLKQESLPFFLKGWIPSGLHRKWLSWRTDALSMKSLPDLRAIFVRCIVISMRKPRLERKWIL